MYLVHTHTKHTHGHKPQNIFDKVVNESRNGILLHTYVYLCNYLLYTRCRLIVHAYTRIHFDIYRLEVGTLCALTPQSPCPQLCKRYKW